MVDSSAPPSPSSARPSTPVVDLEHERAALVDARRAVQAKVAKLAAIEGGGADALADEYIASVVLGAVERMQQDLVVFGRIDDDRPWRVGPLRHRRRRRPTGRRLAGAVRRGLLPGPLRRAARPRPSGQLRRLHRRPVHRGLHHRRGRRLVAAARRARPSPQLHHARRRGHPAVRAGRPRAARPARAPGAARRSGHRQDRRRPAPRRVARLQRPARHRRPHPRHRPQRPVPALRGLGAAHPRRGPGHADHLRAVARRVGAHRRRRALGGADRRASRPACSRRPG